MASHLAALQCHQWQISGISDTLGILKRTGQKSALLNFSFKEYVSSFPTVAVNSRKVEQDEKARWMDGQMVDRQMVDRLDGYIDRDRLID